MKWRVFVWMKWFSLHSKAGRWVPSTCCLVDGRKEEDELSLGCNTESLCATLLWRREEKSSCIVPLTAVIVKRKPGSQVSPPYWTQPKRPKHIKMALHVHGPSLVAHAASKSQFNNLAVSYFLSCQPVLCIGVRLSTEAMWQMINFSGRLEGRRRGRGLLWSEGWKSYGTLKNTELCSWVTSSS